MADLNRDLKEFISNMLSDLESVTKQTLEVGWFEDDTHYVDNDTHATPRDMAYVAYVNEMGAFKRPFFEPTIFAKGDEWMNVFKETDSKKAFEVVGEHVVKDVRDTLDGSHEPLKDSTLAIRKMREDGITITNKLVGEVVDGLARGENYPLSENTQPLNETGQLYDKIKAKVY